MSNLGDLQRDYPWSLRQRTVASLVAVALALFGLVIEDVSAQSTGTPLLVIGTDVVTADLRTATYEAIIRNEGTAAATEVRVSMDVPPDTTFESSNPPSSPPAGSASPSCPDGGKREEPDTGCEWFAGTLAPGERRTLQVVFNLDPSAANPTTTEVDTITVTFKLDGVDPSTNAPIAAVEDSDASLKKATVPTTAASGGGTDTYVDRTEQRDTNHGSCKSLTTKGDGSATAFINPPSNAFTSTAIGTIDRLLDAEFQTHVKASDYSPTAPGGLALHAITSGAWEEGSSCGLSPPGSHPEVRTGSEPVVAAVATASTLIAGPGQVRWNVTKTVDGVAKRAGFAGWEIRNTSGRGSAELSSREADDTALRPRLFLVYTAPETARCIDVDPDFNVNHPNAEQRVTAVVMKSNGTTNYGRQVAGTLDACRGTPVQGHLMRWEIEEEDPDAYISNQAGVLRTKESGVDVGPDTLQTTTNASGATYVGVSLSNPEGTPSGQNRIAGCLTACSGTGTPAEPEDCSGVERELNVCDPSLATGEGATEDDASLTWSPDGPPPPTESHSPSGWPTPDETPSQTPTQTTNQTPDQTAPPSRTSTPSSSSASPTVSAAGAMSPTTLEIASSTAKSIANSEVVLSGILDSEDPACAQPGTTVELFERVAGTTDAQHLAYVPTSVGGHYEHSVSPDVNTFYSAQVGEHGLCAGTQSIELTVLVQPVVTIKSTVKEVKRGRRFWVTGTVMPEHQLSPVTLWRKIGPNKYTKVRRTFLDEASRYSLAVRYKWKKKRSVFVVRWKSQDVDHISGRSDKLVIKRRMRKGT